MKLTYGGGEDDVLLDLSTRELFSWEKDQARLAPYEPRQIYSSRSGLTGEGRIDERRYPQLVRLGYYRTDTSGHHAHGEDLGDVSIWVPIRSHGGIDYSGATVLRRQVHYQDHVVLVPTDGAEILRWIRSWPETYQELEISRYDATLAPSPVKWRLTVCNGARGVNAERFLGCWQQYRDWARVAMEASSGVRRTAHFEAMGLYVYNIDNSYYQIPGRTVYHIGRDGTIDAVFTSADDLPSGYVIDGWHIDDDGFLIWRRRGQTIHVVAEWPRSLEMCRSGLPSLVAYHDEVAIVDWFARPISEWQEHYRGLLRRKEAQDLALYAPAEEALGVLQTHPDMRLSIEDSVRAGNCPTGTRAWAQRYSLGLKDGAIRAQELLAHPQLHEMLAQPEFRKVVLAVGAAQ